MTCLTIKETSVKSTNKVNEAYVFLGFTVALYRFVFWRPLALCKLPIMSFVSDGKGPTWEIAFCIVGGLVPSLLGILLTWKKEGLSGLREFGRHINQFKLGWQWYRLTFLIVIAGTAGQLTINRLLGNTINGTLFLTQLGSFLPLLIPGPLSEEIGWHGYALPHLQTRWNALTSSVILGMVWGLRHLPLFLMVGTSQLELGDPFIGFLIVITACSVLHTWLFNNTKHTLWSPILLHRLYTYTAQVASSGVIRSSRHNWLEMTPSLLMAFAVLIVRGLRNPYWSSRKQPASNFGQCQLCADSSVTS